MDRANLLFLLTASRLVLGPLHAAAVVALGPSAFAAGEVATAGPGGAALPLAIAVVASATDFVDGRVARRLGAVSSRGAILDVLADGVFLLCALFALAAVGALSWALPVAALASLSALALRWHRDPPMPRPPGAPPVPRRRADAVGHAAGILNYGAVLVASGVPLGWISPRWLPAASVVVAAVNLAPIALRAVAR